MMFEKIQDHFYEARIHWRYLRKAVPQIRGILTDRQGKHYWRLVEEYAPGHFEISFSAWPSFTYQNTGWLSVGEGSDKSTWIIHDVRVDNPHEQQRGIGTALVLAAIKLAQRHTVSRLQGFVTRDDAEDYPFLPAWYARLGFTVQFMTKGDAVAVFWMDLQTPAK